jgi:hypothetical protein
MPINGSTAHYPESRSDHKGGKVLSRTARGNGGKRSDERGNDQITRFVICRLSEIIHKKCTLQFVKYLKPSQITQNVIWMAFCFQ